jgi:hypothetical protein
VEDLGAAKDVAEDASYRRDGLQWSEGLPYRKVKADAMVRLVRRRSWMRHEGNKSKIKTTLPS